MALARQASDKADEAKTLSAVLLAKLTDHVEGCGKNWDKLERVLANTKTDGDEWRAGLGRRLDRQDKLMWGALVSVLGLALTVIGFLIEHSKLFS